MGAALAGLGSFVWTAVRMHNNACRAPSGGLSLAQRGDLRNVLFRCAEGGLCASNLQMRHHVLWNAGLCFCVRHSAASAY